ncbi:hypothetical protein H6G36_25545 [Anabaena minutissima FACHB-250]|nr:hypothetical protein [Anabaena minutissima FACHB-250]
MAETIKSATPIVLAITGGAIALCSIFSPSITSEKFAVSMGVAGTFGAAAAGLASPQRDRN